MRLQMLGLAIEDADAGGAIGLVAGEDVEIRIEGLDIDGHVNGGLAAIDQHRDAAGMGELDDLLDRDDGAERVRHLGDGDDLGARAEQLFEFVEEEIAVIIDRRPFDDGAAALAVEMPGHDVGMVLQDGEHDLIALVDHQAAKALGHEIDGLGGVAGEDQLILGRRIEKAAHAFAGILEALGCRVGKEMQAAMDIGIFLGVALHDGIKHGLGLLRRGGIVEIDQRLAIDLARQDREVAADLASTSSTARSDARLRAICWRISPALP